MCTKVVTRMSHLYTLAYQGITTTRTITKEDGDNTKGYLLKNTTEIQEGISILIPADSPMPCLCVCTVGKLSASAGKNISIPAGKNIRIHRGNTQGMPQEIHRGCPCGVYRV